jgi:arylsulfatase A-like enzyme
MLERCESPAVGLVHAPIYHPHAPRSGDHTVNSQLWVSGPDVVGTRENGRGNVLDIAPTILAALDVTLPEWLDGRALPVSAAMDGPRPADGVEPSALSAAD